MTTACSPNGCARAPTRCRTRGCGRRSPRRPGGRWCTRSTAGSAVTGAGVDALIEGIAELLPGSAGDPEGPLSGSVFTMERGLAGERIAYVRLTSGTLHVRDRPPLHRDGAVVGEGRVTALSVFDHGTAVPAPSAAAGRIARVWGLGEVRIGDTVGAPAQAPGAAHHFSPPNLETVVAARRPADRAALHTALGQLAEQDPLINLRRDEDRGEIAVSLYGEVQKEVIQATLADDYGVEADFRETTTIHIEQVTGSGAAVEFNKKDANPFLATVGLRVDPAPRRAASPCAARSNWAPCPTRSSSPSRRRFAPRWPRGCTAGRSPTARSP